MTEGSRPYSDPRVPLVNAELKKHAVAIVPIEPPSEADALPTLNSGAQGSGTRIRIEGRFFVATAAHVVLDFPNTRYAGLRPTPRTTRSRLSEEIAEAVLAAMSSTFRGSSWHLGRPRLRDGAFSTSPGSRPLTDQDTSSASTVRPLRIA